MQTWLVDGLIKQGHTVLVLGKPHGGKSWIVDDLAVAVSSGTKFVGTYDVEHNDVILLDDDSPISVVKNRIQRLAAGRDIDSKDLRLTIMSHGSILRPGWDKFKETDMGCDFSMKDYNHREWLTHEINKFDHPLVIMDSLIKVMAGVSLDRTGHAMKAVEYWRTIKDQKTTFVVPHHMSLKGNKDINSMDFDPSALAMGNTMIVGSCDTVLYTHRVPVDTTTEFIIRPIARRDKLAVGVFSCELVEDKTMTWARMESLGEPAHLPSDNARSLFPVLYMDDDERKGMTIEDIMKEIHKGLGEKEIRESLKELETEGVIIRRAERHNRFRYRINPVIDSGFCVPTAYIEVLMDIVEQ